MMENQSPSRLRVLQHRTFDDGNTQVRLQDTEGQEFLLKIWDGDLPAFEFREDEWILLEDALGDIYNGDVNVGSNYSDVQLTYLESPPSSVDQDEPDNTAADSTNNQEVSLYSILKPFPPFQKQNSSLTIQTTSNYSVSALDMHCTRVPQGDPQLLRSGTTDVSEAATTAIL